MSELPVSSSNYSVIETVPRGWRSALAAQDEFFETIFPGYTLRLHIYGVGSAGYKVKLGIVPANNALATMDESDKQIGGKYVDALKAVLDRCCSECGRFGDEMQDDDETGFPRCYTCADSWDVK